jgi:hypothetical protein
MVEDPAGAELSGWVDLVYDETQPGHAVRLVPADATT